MSFFRPTKVTWVAFLVVLIVPVLSLYLAQFIDVPGISQALIFVDYGPIILLALSMEAFRYLGPFFPVGGALILYVLLLYVISCVIAWLLSRYFSRKLAYGICIFAVVIAAMMLGMRMYYHRNDKAFVVLPLDTSCYPLAAYAMMPSALLPPGESRIPQEMEINSQADYEKLLPYRESKCTSQLPPVDFTASTVLAKYAFGSCDAYGFDRTYSRDDATKTITYSVYPKTHALMFCSGPGLESMNLIVVPKIPDDYKVIFEPQISYDQHLGPIRAIPTPGPSGRATGT